MPAKQDQKQKEQHSDWHKKEVEARGVTAEEKGVAARIATVGAGGITSSARGDTIAAATHAGTAPAMS